MTSPTTPTPYYEREGVRLYLGDCRDVLGTLDKASIDLVLTDPPYSSGGMMRSDRNMQPDAKYQFSGTVRQLSGFSGDNRDQRSFLIWSDLWLRQCLAMSTDGTALIVFIDWRQLATMTDAVQVAGWVYRGIALWDKTEAARPQKGWFRAQCEFMVLASAGPLNNDRDGESAPGVFRYPTVREREHVTEKPVELLTDILRTGERFATVLDPFMGSGSTGEACVRLGRKFVGIELEERWCEHAAKRLDRILSEPRLPFVEERPEVQTGLWDE